jgi:hypothetical protein
VSAIAGILAMAFLVFFAVGLASRVRAGGGSGWLANGTVGGAVFAAAGFAPLLAFTWLLASDVKFLTASAVQTLNVLQNDMFLPTLAGFFVFGVVGGLAAVVGKAPARWMGWVLLVVGIAAVVPRSRGSPCWPSSSGCWWPASGWRPGARRGSGKASRRSASRACKAQIAPVTGPPRGLVTGCAAAGGASAGEGARRAGAASVGEGRDAREALQ